MDRKKELKRQYKEMRPEMGIYVVRSKSNDKFHLEATSNLKSGINRTNFQLKHGSHPNRELQKDWQDLGEDNFTIEILDNLEYDKDEGKNDYTEDLEILRTIWEEKLVDHNLSLYKK